MVEEKPFYENLPRLITTLDSHRALVAMGRFLMVTHFKGGLEEVIAAWRPKVAVLRHYSLGAFGGEVLAALEAKKKALEVRAAAIQADSDFLRTGVHRTFTEGPDDPRLDVQQVLGRSEGIEMKVVPPPMPGDRAHDDLHLEG